ncbi:XkdX family protein [Lactobacillus sp. PV034]|uniref:XkdX family protein n=1 Tax=Lactobacillus sp. PV034 TaxID=2594495 RepID=UPI00223FF81F|nr:XkdX family protein [Lactobacillus sp. PV034]QNQ80772.1 XkdX family protein [Lactobacillus sp. PV034]
MFDLAKSFEFFYKKYYDMGIYTKKNIANFVKMGCVGSDAYKRITGENYEERNSESTTTA